MTLYFKGLACLGYGKFMFLKMFFVCSRAARSCELFLGTCVNNYTTFHLNIQPWFSVLLVWSVFGFFVGCAELVWIALSSKSPRRQADIEMTGSERRRSRSDLFCNLLLTDRRAQHIMDRLAQYHAKKNSTHVPVATFMCT